MKKIGKYLLKALLAAFGALPLRVHYVFADFLAFLAHRVIRYRVDVVMDNLRGSFPDRSEEEIKAICKDFYRHFGNIVAEAIWFGGCRNPERLRRSHIVEIADIGSFRSVFERVPSVVVMYSHCGNWELLGGIASYNYSDVPTCFREDNYCVVYKKMSSQVWDEVMRDNRFAPLLDRDNFPGYIETNGLIRYVISNKAEKKIYNINTDQRPYSSARGTVPVRFMHRDCTSMAAAANLAAKFGFAVFYQRMTNDRRGHYTLEYVPICEDAREMSAEQIMQRYYDLLQADIEAQPANYLWTHKRWK